MGWFEVESFHRQAVGACASIDLVWDTTIAGVSPLEQSNHQRRLESREVKIDS
jgi:hypothetical protein